MSTPAYQRAQGGFTILQLVVVLFVVGLLTYTFSGAFSQQIDNAKITAMVTKMRQIAAEGQAYHSGIQYSSTNSAGVYQRVLMPLPSPPNQIAKFNSFNETRLPETNQFGQPYVMYSGGGGRVFVRTVIPADAVGDSFNPSGATASRVGSKFQITVMALSDGGANYERKSRAYKNYFEVDPE